MKKIICVLFLLVLGFVFVGCGSPKATTYQITWNDENGSLITITTVDEGAIPVYSYTKNDTAEWDYTVKGWSTTKDGEILTSIPAAAANATYFAIVEQVKMKYEVKFESNSGSIVESKTVEYGGTLAEPTDPTRDNYTFAGWFTNSQLTTAANWPITVTSNITLYASWTEGAPTTYQITWNDENGDLITTTTVNEGRTPSYSYTKTDTAEWDYTVKGWSTTKNGEVLTSIPAATENTTYFAVVEQVKKTYTVKFESNSGSGVESNTVEYGTSLAEPTKPTRDGHRFVAWCTDPQLQNVVSWPITVTSNITLYASWNEVMDIKLYLEELLNGFMLNPYSYIPETMQPQYSANLVSANTATLDYSSFVNKTDIISNGFGEQWHMVTENLQQSMVFFNALTVIEGLTSSSIVAFNNWFDSNPSDSATYSFASGEYNVTIDFNDKTLTYALEYTRAFPVIGEQTAQIKLSLDLETNIKKVRVQLGEANVLEYEVAPSSYTFAIKYAGIRKASFTISKDEDGNVEGYINEVTKVSELEMASNADFYIDEDYVTVVGNKAGGLLGFKGYICEVYNVTNGKLLGYEVRETLSLITYNTLWFDLTYVNGINNIKYQPATETEAAVFYVNNSTTAWEAKKVGGFSIKSQSRRFDIEFRTQYFYSYDSATKSYNEIKVEVPMLFVQEENYSTFVDDVSSTNSNLVLSITLNSTHLTKIQEEYDTLVDVFIENNHTLIEVE